MNQTSLSEHKRLLLALAAVILTAGGGYAYYQSTLQPETQDLEEEVTQTATVREGDLEVYASGSGTLIVGEEIELGFGANGIIAELNVQVGDEITAGEVLAVQADRQELELAVAAAKIDLINAQEDLDAIHDNAAAVTAQAALDLANAQDELRIAEYTHTVNQEGYRASDLTIKTAEAKLATAKDALDEAKAAYNKYSGRDEDDPQRANALIKMYNAQQNYDSALRNLNWYTGYPSDIEQAQMNAEVALAEAAVAAAERAYEQVRDGPDANELAKAELKLASAEAQLAVAEYNLEHAIIKAPSSGTVLEVSANAGDEVNNPFITLADLTQLYVEVHLDETDMDMIDLDYEVEVIFDALPDLTFSGRIIQVDPSLRSSGNITTIQAKAMLDLEAGPAAENLLIGMNAAVDVIAGRAEGVPLVPVEALRELAPGEYAVFVMVDGQPKLRPVEVGLMDISFAEIVSGVEPGEVVTTGIVETE